MDIKHCNGCGLDKGLDEFYRKGAGYSSHCKTCIKAYNTTRYHEVHKLDPDYKQKKQTSSHDWYIRNQTLSNARSREKDRAIRRQCIEHYGRICACCGETRYEFLALDHINGGGNKHRKEIGCTLSRWLIRNDLPEGFRVLCHNCNSAYGHYGFCPHEKEREERLRMWTALRESNLARR